MNYILLTIMPFASIALYAGNRGTTQTEAGAWESPWKTCSNYFEYNPSATFSVPAPGYAIIGTSYSTSKADKGFYQAQEGNGSSAFQIHTESFHQESKQSFFGEANFIRDQKNNVQWRDVEDASLLSPYLIADSIGGDYRREAYTMGGGTSFRCNQWEYGIRGEYEGGVSYRKVDPRPLNTVSIIRINPGITFSTGNWKYGWFGRYERYRQNIDINVEKSDRKVYFYLLQGFGTYNKQFSELSETYNRIYKGNEYATGFHINYLGEKQATGGLISLRRGVYEASESDKRTPYSITHNGIKAEFTHERSLLDQTLFLNGQYGFHQVIGNETQYYPTIINTSFVIWNFATQSDRYQSRNQNARISALLADKDLSKFSIWEQIEGNWQDNKQYYYTPDYHQYIQDLCGSASIGFHKPLAKSSLEGSIKAGYKKVLSSSLLQNENNVITTRVILPDYAFLTTDYAFYQFHLRVRFRLSPSILANFSMGGGLQKAKNQQSYFTTACMALNF
ncbi:MAG: hypothetical protein PHR38_05970 [Bacteroidales bacterium]|nr:hypothetical protein [Bacteroidales bacterium]MDD4713315.1 hypothetical protein [Bacteroidales bacterium]